VERWKDDGSLVSSPGDPLPVKFPTLSFQDALLAHRALTVELAMAGTVVITPVDPPAPRSQAASDVHAAAPSHSKEEGWQQRRIFLRSVGISRGAYDVVR
jgi:hypothetical protein